jgi:hypothetical protein
MTAEEEQNLIDDYLKYLEYVRLPEKLPTTKEESKQLIEEISARTAANPYFEAWETLDDLVDDDPEAAWKISLAILEQCNERDYGALGAGPLEQLIWHHWSILVDRFDGEIARDERFRDAFTYIRMGGVPLAVQRRLNEALVRAGIAPDSLIEFDETIPED